MENGGRSSDSRNVADSGRSVLLNPTMSENQCRSCCICDVGWSSVHAGQEQPHGESIGYSGHSKPLRFVTWSEDARVPASWV
jgi:hypothetical protein